MKHSNGLFALVGVLTVATLVILPLSLPYLVRRLELGSAPGCLGNMGLVARGYAPDILHCPESDASYRIETVADEKIIACPARAPHLAYRPRFVLRDDVWRFVFDLPESSESRSSSGPKIHERL